MRPGITTTDEPIETIPTVNYCYRLTSYYAWPKTHISKCFCMPK